jgi:hypothetical protein
MPSKKMTKTTRTPKTARGKTRLRLTSAIGPKATVSVVICVLAGGLIVGAHQARPKTLPASDVHVDMTPVLDVAAKKTAVSYTATPSTRSAASPSKAPSMTLAGCLEHADEGFWLKDATGADAPKARSWKSGFLKKGSARVDVVDPSHTLRLSDYVGRRVSVTGTLADHQLQARSLRRVAVSCAN